MKKLSIITVILILTMGGGIAQTLKQQVKEASENYNSLYQFIKDNPKIETDSTFLKLFERHDFWWQHRADEQGNYDTYHKQLQKFLKTTNKSTTHTQTWENPGPRYLGQTRSNIGRVNSIWINPDNTDHIKIGSASAGLWETTNGGDNWTCLTPEVPGGVKDFIVHPDNKDTVYGIMEVHNNGMYHHWGGYGIFKSTQGGLNPEMMLTDIYQEHAGIGEIIFKPGDPQTIYVLSNNKVYISTDAGENFTEVIIGVEDGKNVADLAFSETNPNIGFAYGRGSLYRTTDGGYTWNDVYDSVPVDWGVIWDENGQTENFDNINDGYRGMGGRNVMGVFDDEIYIFRHAIVIENNDTTFKKELLVSNVDTIDFQSYYHSLGGYDPYNIRQANNGNIAICARYTLLYFDPESDNWAGYYYPIHQDIRDVAFWGNSADDFILATDGGVEFESNTYINGDLALSEIHGHTVFKQNRENYRVGTHDDGGFYHDENGWHDANDWQNEGAVSWQDQTDFDHYAYNGGYSKNMIVMNNGSQEMTDTVGGLGKPYFQDPEDPLSFWNTLFYGSRGLVFYKYKPSLFGNQRIDSLSLNNMWGIKGLLRFGGANSNVILASTYDPWPNGGNHFHFARSLDGGQTWTRLDQTISELNAIRGSGLMISDIEINPEDDSEFWITFSRFMENDNIRVMHTTDSGNNWEDITANLMDFPVTQIEYHAPTGRLFVGTDIGLYEYNGNQSWTRHAGFPIVPVTKMIINDIYQDLTVGTYGRGLWRTNPACTNGNQYVVSENQTWNDYTFPCSNVIVTNQSTLTVNAKLKMPPESVILVDTGAVLVLNHKLELGANAQLILKKDAQLVINDSTLVFDTGQVFETEDNVTIRITNTAELIVHGDYSYSETDFLKIEGNGYADINYDSKNAQNLYLQGINDRLSFKSNSMDIRSEQFYADSVKIYPGHHLLIDHVDSLTIQNCIIDASYGFLHIAGPEKMTFRNSVVKNGIGSMGSLYIHELNNVSHTLKNVTFHSNKLGLKSYGGGINLTNCTFYNNEKGWDAYNMSALSSISNSTFNDHSHRAISYNGYNNATLKIKSGTHIDNNERGLYVSGPFKTEIQCSTIEDNNLDGISIQHSSLYADHSNIDGNNIGIQSVGDATHYSTLNIDNSYNSFVSDSMAIQGYFAHKETLDASHNRWNVSGGSPVYDQHYHTNTSKYPYPPFYITDNYPITSVPACAVPQPGGGSDLGKSVLSSMIIDADRLYEESKYLSAADIYNSVVWNATINTPDQDWPHIWHAYKQYQNISGMFNQPQILEELIKMQNHLLSCITDHNYGKKLYLNIVQAQTFRLKNDFLGSIIRFEEILKFAHKEDFESVVELMCQVKTDYEIRNGNLLPNELNDYQNQCICNYNYIGNGKSIKGSNKKENNYLLIQPNPATESFSISIEVPGKFKNIEVIIKDIEDVIVWQQKVNDANEELIINTNELSNNKGLFVVSLYLDNNKVESEKLLVK